jgi:hypothetical protein
MFLPMTEDPKTKEKPGNSGNSGNSPDFAGFLRQQ